MFDINWREREFQHTKNLICYLHRLWLHFLFNSSHESCSSLPSKHLRILLEILYGLGWGCKGSNIYMTEHSAEVCPQIKDFCSSFETRNWTREWEDILKVKEALSLSMSTRCLYVALEFAPSQKPYLQVKYLEVASHAELVMNSFRTILPFTGLLESKLPAQVVSSF